MLLEIGPKACSLVACVQTLPGSSFCLRKTQLVGSLKVLAFPHLCSASPVVELRMPQTVEQVNKEPSTCLQRGFRCSAGE